MDQHIIKKTGKRWNRFPVITAKLISNNTNLTKTFQRYEKKF